MASSISASDTAPDRRRITSSPLGIARPDNVLEMFFTMSIIRG
jgi:hypothetical protein